MLEIKVTNRNRSAGEATPGFVLLQLSGHHQRVHHTPLHGLLV